MLRSVWLRMKYVPVQYCADGRPSRASASLSVFWLMRLQSSYTEVSLQTIVQHLTYPEANVAKAHTATAVLFEKKDGLRKLKSVDVLAAFDGDNRLTRIPWNEAVGKPVAKVAADSGILKSRGGL